MRNHLIRLNLLMAFLLILLSCNRGKTDHVTYKFDLKKLSLNNKIATITYGNGFGSNVLLIHVRDGKNQIPLTTDSDKINWERSKYLVCDIYNSNEYSLIMYIDFYKQQETDEVLSTDKPEEPRISPKVGILPGVVTRVIFPLSYLDGQQIFMNRFPRQLKGTVMGHRLDPSGIGKVVLRFEPVMDPGYLPEIELQGVFLTDSLPEPLGKLSSPVVDEFGQWTMKDWKGKIHSEAELKNNFGRLDTIIAGSNWPESWSKYGGWKEKKFRKTGFFHTFHDGNRWWLVDPDGFAFLSAGIDCVLPNASGVVNGQEDMFTWLPPRYDSVYAPAYSKRRGERLEYDYLKSNLIRTYGTDWRKNWERLSAGLLRAWSVNTIANWSDLDFAMNAKIPYVLDMSDFPGTEINLYRDFPDVFSVEYARNCTEFASQLRSFRDDPYLIGYFLSNEPHWAFGNNNLAFEMFATKTSSATRNAMITWLKRTYKNDISAFNTAWKTDFTGFEQLDTFSMSSSPSQECWNNCLDFSTVMVEKYIKQVCDEVRKVDPNHLNLGMRYAWISSELCYQAGTYFDVFSINGYSFPGPPETAEIARRSGKPVMIGEYHFGSVDRGLPATGIQGAASQEERGDAYRYYFEQGFARPELIGIHYFQFMDQPVFGRFDGENYNIGFLDICMNPYIELATSAKLSHDRMYKIATGELKPFDKTINKVPPIYY